MSFSYDNNLTTSLDMVRFNIQDVEDDCADFSDEEVAATLSMNNGLVIKTSRSLLQKLWIKYAKAPSKVEVDGVRMDNPKQGEYFKALYDGLADQEKKESITSGKAAIYYGGIDRDRFNSVRDDSTLVNSRFTRQQIDWSQRFPQTTPLDKDIYRFEWRITDE